MKGDGIISWNGEWRRGKGWEYGCWRANIKPGLQFLPFSFHCQHSSPSSGLNSLQLYNHDGRLTALSQPALLWPLSPLSTHSLKGFPPKPQIHGNLDGLHCVLYNVRSQSSPFSGPNYLCMLTPHQYIFLPSTCHWATAAYSLLSPVAITCLTCLSLFKLFFLPGMPLAFCRSLTHFSRSNTNVPIAPISLNHIIKKKTKACLIW